MGAPRAQDLLELAVLFEQIAERPDAPLAWQLLAHLRGAAQGSTAAAHPARPVLGGTKQQTQQQ
jgi:hypothetical protein